MKSTPYYLLYAAAGTFLVLGSPSFGQGRTPESQSQPSRMTEESQAQPIQMSEVPKLARDAAEKALHTAPTDAKVIVGTSPQEYELMAKDNSGKSRSIHVLADGTVLKIKGQREAKAPEGTPRR